LYTLHLTTVCN